MREGGFDFVEGHRREGDHAGAGQRQFCLGTMAQKGGERDGAIFLARSLFQQPTQSRRHAAGGEGVVISPEIDPRRCFLRNLVQQTL